MKLDYALIMDWRDIRIMPLSFINGKDHKDILGGMRRLVGREFGNGELYIKYNRTLFTASLNSSRVPDGKIRFSLSLWDQYFHAGLTTVNHTAQLGTNWIKDTFPQEKLDKVEELLHAYVYHRKRPCSICKEVYKLHELKAFPFAGVSCKQCREEGKVPRVYTN